MFAQENCGINSNQWVIVFVFVAWLGATFVGFWWFQYKDMRSFSWENNKTERSVKFNGQELEKRLLAEFKEQGDDRITLFNFASSDCACNKFNLSHLQKLNQKYGEAVRFVTLMSPSHPDSSDLKRYSSSTGITARYSQNLKRGDIPAAPSAALLDKNGKLIYFGPFSDGAFCGQGKNLVESRITQALSQKTKAWLNTRAYGCYCDW